MKTDRIFIIVVLTSLIVSGVGCATTRTCDDSRPRIYQNDETARSVRPVVDLDDVVYEIRFENADLLTIVDSLNKLTDNFTCVLALGSGSAASRSQTAGSEKELSPGEKSVSLTGYFKGTYKNLIRDICLSSGLTFDRIDENFYIGKNSLDVSMCLTSATIETTLNDEDLDKLLKSFGSDVSYTLVSSRLLITGRFYAVKQFRTFVQELNENRRSYVARVVFVRLDRASVARLEAEVKASRLDLISAGYNLYDIFESQLDCKLSKDNSYNFSEQLLYCSDGQKSTLKIGSTFSREQRAVSDYGTSTTTGYQQFEDGVDIELTPYRSINGLVDVALKFDNSKFSDTSNLAKNQVNLNYDRLTLEENRLYFVASFNDESVSSGARILGASSSQDKKALTCWLVISPVKSDVYCEYDSVIR